MTIGDNTNTQEHHIAAEQHRALLTYLVHTDSLGGPDHDHPG